jgi:predicted RNase H-like HicB family nuclease
MRKVPWLQPRTRKEGKVKYPGLKYPGFVEFYPETGKYGAFLLDLPVYVAGKGSFEEAKKALEEGAGVYLAYMKAEGKPIPEPGTNSSIAFEEEIATYLTPISIEVPIPAEV